MLLINMVLYADDDVDDINLVEAVFSTYSNNVQLVTVSDGLEVLSFLKNLPKKEPEPCLIILDINMPGLNGKETLEHVRKMERFKDVPVVLFTTSFHQKDKEFARTYNARFVTKPTDYAQMDVIAGKFIEQCVGDVQKNIKKEVTTTFQTW